MGTSFSIKVSKIPDSFNKESIDHEIDSLLSDLNGQMSTYIEDSELSTINQTITSDWIPVSESLYTVLNKALEVSRLSGGAFDISIGPLVNAWGFGPDMMTFEEPDQALVSKLLNQVGYQSIKLNEHTSSIRKLKADLYMDLSAVAKGYAVDQVAELLEAQNVQDYLVEIGGEIRLKGQNMKKQPWRIAVEKPDPDKRMIQKVLPITDIAVATSGDYRNFFEIEGTRFSHTIDPRNGRPIKHKLASVTVLTETCMEADALATAIMVLGPEQGLELAEREGIAALFIIKAEQGFIEKQSSAYANLIQ